MAGSSCFSKSKRASFYYTEEVGSPCHSRDFSFLSKDPATSHPPTSSAPASAVYKTALIRCKPLTIEFPQSRFGNTVLHHKPQGGSTAPASSPSPVLADFVRAAPAVSAAELTPMPAVERRRLQAFPDAVNKLASFAPVVSATTTNATTPTTFLRAALARAQQIVPPPLRSFVVSADCSRAARELLEICTPIVAQWTLLAIAAGIPAKGLSAAVRPCGNESHGMLAL